MKTLLIIPFLCISFFSFSQNSTQDSLVQILETRIERDSVRVAVLLKASSFYRFKEFEKGLPYITEALEISQSQNLTIQQGISLRSLASYYLRKGLYDKGIENAIKALKILGEANAEKEILTTNSLLARLYRDKGFLEKALEMNLQNIQLVKNSPESSQKAKFYFDLGNSYNALKQFKKAEDNYIIAADISKSISFVPGEMTIKLTLAQLYKNMDEYRKAETIFTQILPYYIQKKQLATEALIYYELATINSLEGKHQASIPLYNKSLKIYNKIGKLYFVKDINQKLFIAYNIVGDLPKAKEANLVYNQLKDSIDNQENQKLIADMKTKYETDQIEADKQLAENRAQLAEVESEKNRLLFWGAISISILLIVAYTFYFAKQKQAKKAEIIKLELRASQKQLALEKQYRDSELKALKAQMNPHFIFNVLNSIQEFIVLNQKELASEYLAMFAELIRSYLHFSNTGVITLKEETDTLTKYLELETLRFEDSFTYDLSIDELIHPEELNIPTMIVQPYVENAIKHGLFHKQNERKLMVDFSVLSNSVLQCVITDNGIGREESKRINSAKKANGHKSFAMEATANRLELYNQKTSNKIGVETIDLFTDNREPKGTKVILTIPLI